MRRLTDTQKLIAVLAAHAVVGAVVFRYGTDLQDEGLLYAWGKRLLDGELPYTDFYLVQAPGTFYVQALLMKLFGVSLIVGRVFKQAQGLLIVLLSCVAVRRATMSTSAGWIAAAAAAVFSGAIHFRTPWYGTDACALLLVATWAACKSMEGRRVGSWVITGATLAGATFFKQNHGLFGALAMGSMLVWYEWRATSGSVASKALASVRVGAVLFAAFATTLGLYVVYYAMAGGSLHLMWMNGIVWASEAKDFASPLETFLYPIKVFTLFHKGSWVFPATALALLAGVAITMSARAPKWARLAGVALALATLAMGVEVIARVYTLTLLSTLIFAIAVAAVLEAAATPLSSPSGRSAHAAAMVAVVAACNLYGGTIPGGGWGRLVETLPGSLLTFGVGAHLLTQQGGRVAHWWTRNVWVSPRVFGTVLGLSAVAVSVGLLIKNQAYRPGLDVELRAMTGRASDPAWRGIRGEPLYVTETDELLASLREASRGRPRTTLYVFPLNSAIYPFSGLRNATAFDSHQVDFLAPSRFPEVVAQLRDRKPALVVLQRQANHARGPDFDDPGIWVRDAIRIAVHDFVHANYTLRKQWKYYELWVPRSS